MELQTFSNDQFGVLRTAEINNKIYYCGTDVAKSLGYSKPQDAVTRHCRYSVKHGVPHPQNPTKQIEMSFIPEGDVYRLTARSKLPQAEKFESWVFDEVLPQIARTGSYNLPSTPEEKLDLLVEVAHNQKDKVEKIDERVTHLETNARIDPTQYGYIGSLVNKQQCGVLRHGINKDICSAMNARPRTQIRAKDFDKACTFIEGWNPSSVTLKEIEELAGE